MSAGAPEPPIDLITLGRTLTSRAADVLNYVDRPRHQQRSDRRLEHLRGTAWVAATAPTTS